MTEFLNFDLLNLKTASAFIILVLTNVAVMRSTMQSIKGEVEKLEKKLELLHTHLLKVSVLEARLGHLEKDINKTQNRVDIIEERFLFRFSTES